MPEGAVYVGRPTKWGNPFDWTKYPAMVTPSTVDGDLEPIRVADSERRRWAVVDFESAVRFENGTLPDYPSQDEIRRDLAGKDLVCWCPANQPCHASVLLQIANGGAR